MPPKTKITPSPSARNDASRRAYELSTSKPKLTRSKELTSHTKSKIDELDTRSTQSNLSEILSRDGYFQGMLSRQRSEVNNHQHHGGGGGGGGGSAVHRGVGSTGGNKKLSVNVNSISSHGPQISPANASAMPPHDHDERRLSVLSDTTVQEGYMASSHHQTAGGHSHYNNGSGTGTSRSYTSTTSTAFSQENFLEFVDNAPPDQLAAMMSYIRRKFEESQRGECAGDEFVMDGFEGEDGVVEGYADDEDEDVEEDDGDDDDFDEGFEDDGLEPRFSEATLDQNDAQDHPEFSSRTSTPSVAQRRKSGSSSGTGFYAGEREGERERDYSSPALTPTSGRKTPGPGGMLHGTQSMHLPHHGPDLTSAHMSANLIPLSPAKASHQSGTGGLAGAGTGSSLPATAVVSVSTSHRQLHTLAGSSHELGHEEEDAEVEALKLVKVGHNSATTTPISKPLHQASYGSKALTPNTFRNNGAWPNMDKMFSGSPYRSGSSNAHGAPGHHTAAPVLTNNYMTASSSNNISAVAAAAHANLMTQQHLSSVMLEGSPPNIGSFVSYMTGCDSAPLSAGGNGSANKLGNITFETANTRSHAPNQHLDHSPYKNHHKPTVKRSSSNGSVTSLVSDQGADPQCMSADSNDYYDINNSSTAYQYPDDAPPPPVDMPNSPLSIKSKTSAFDDKSVGSTVSSLSCNSNSMASPRPYTGHTHSHHHSHHSPVRTSHAPAQQQQQRDQTSYYNHSSAHGSEAHHSGHGDRQGGGSAGGTGSTAGHTPRPTLSSITAPHTRQPNTSTTLSNTILNSGGAGAGAVGASSGGQSGSRVSPHHRPHQSNVTNTSNIQPQALSPSVSVPISSGGAGSQGSPLNTGSGSGSTRGTVLKSPSRLTPTNLTTASSAERPSSAHLNTLAASSASSSQSANIGRKSFDGGMPSKSSFAK